MDDKKLKKIREKRNRERQAKLEYGVAVGAAICFLIICVAVFAKWTKAVRERKLMEEEREGTGTQFSGTGGVDRAGLQLLQQSSGYS